MFDLIEKTNNRVVKDTNEFDTTGDVKDTDYIKAVLDKGLSLVDALNNTVEGLMNFTAINNE